MSSSDQDIPNSGGQSSDDATKGSGSSLSTAVIAVIAVIGALVGALVLYQTYRFVSIYRKKNRSAPMPMARPLLIPPTTPVSPGTPQGTPHGTLGSTGGGSLSVLMTEADGPGASLHGVRANRESGSWASTSVPFPPGAYAENTDGSGKSSPVTPQFGAQLPAPEPNFISAEDRRASSLTMPSPPFHSSSRSSMYSLGGGTPNGSAVAGSTSNRRSVYAMSLYSTPHHSANAPPTPYNPRPLSTHRISGAPHAASSRIEIVPPTPLGPPPGAVVAEGKSSLGFTRMSGINAGEDWFKQMSSSGYAAPPVAAPDSDIPTASARINGHRPQGSRPQLSTEPVHSQSSHSPSYSVSTTGGPFPFQGSSRSETPDDANMSANTHSSPGGTFRDPSVSSSPFRDGNEHSRGSSSKSRNRGSNSGREANSQKGISPGGTEANHDDNDDDEGGGGTEEDVLVQGSPRAHNGESLQQSTRSTSISRGDGGSFALPVTRSPLEKLQSQMKRKAKLEARKSRKEKDVSADADPTHTSQNSETVQAVEEPGSTHQRNLSETSHNTRPPSVYLDKILDGGDRDPGEAVEVVGQIEGSRT